MRKRKLSERVEESELTGGRKEGRKIGNSVSTAFLLQTFAAIVAGAVSKWRAFEACELVSSEC